MPIPRGRKGVKKVMEEWKAGGLHSGSKTGPVVPVSRPDMAYAIANRQAGMPKKRGRGRRTQSIVDRIDRGKKDYRV